jgi:hypothetical protein
LQPASSFISVCLRGLLAAAVGGLAPAHKQQCSARLVNARSVAGRFHGRHSSAHYLEGTFLFFLLRAIIYFNRLRRRAFIYFINLQPNSS